MTTRSPLGPGRTTAGRRGLRGGLVALALLGSLVACGDNTNVGRGETDCDAGSSTAANNPHDASCQQTGSNSRGNG
jgi:hypothetical protein